MTSKTELNDSILSELYRLYQENKLDYQIHNSDKIELFIKGITGIFCIFYPKNHLNGYYKFVNLNGGFIIEDNWKPSLYKMTPILKEIINKRETDFCEEKMKKTLEILKSK